MNITIITLISCVIVIFLMVLRYELKINKLLKHNKKLAKDNVDLLQAVDSLIVAGSQLSASHDALYEILKEEFTEEEIKELYREKLRTILIERLQGRDLDGE